MSEHSENPTLEGSAMPRNSGLPVPVVALALLLPALALALVPFDVQASYKASNYDVLDSVSLNIEKSDAYGWESPTYGEYQQFVDDASSAIGMDSSEFVTTVIMASMLGTGYNILKDDPRVNPVSYANSVSDNLNALIDAADYPDWHTLTAEEQAGWVNQDNYNCAKFKSLLSGLGMGDLYEEWRDDLEGSGGGNFDWPENLKDRGNQLYRIGNLWKSRLGVMLGDVRDMITDRDAIAGFFPSGSGSIYDGTGNEDWPIVEPTVEYSDNLRDEIYYHSTETKTNFRVWASLSTVYQISFWDKQEGQTRGSFSHYYFSKQPFSSGTAVGSTNISYSEATSYADIQNYGRVYWKVDFTSYYSIDSATFPINSMSVSQGDARVIMAMILYDAAGSTSTGERDIVDYPEDVNPNQRVYVPSGGANGGTTYNDYRKYENPIRDNETPYNPDNQTQTNEWKVDAEENVLPLLNLPFDKLFPFCLIYDIPLFMNKVFDTVISDGSGGISTQAEEDYESLKLEFPAMDSLGFDEITIEIDLSDVKTLADDVKPVIDMLIICLFLFSSIEFWKAIITG